MPHFRDLPIRRKLTLALASTSMTVALLAAVAFISYDYVDYRSDSVRNLETQARVTAESVAPLLLFNDPKTATETLAVLRSDPHILSAAAYQQDGRTFAVYRRPPGGAAGLPATAPADGARYGPDALEVTQPIEVGDRRVGSIYVRSDVTLLEARLVRSMGITGLILIGATTVVWWMSGFFQKTIAKPIADLALTAAHVAEHRTYDARVTAQSRDEIGTLIQAFNGMLEQVQLRDTELRHENAERRRAETDVRELNTTLEERVLQRTAQLEASNRELAAAKEAAEAASRAKSAFLATMSHELRTPLNAIIGYSELLTEQAEEENQPAFVSDLGKIRSAGKHLLSLINDVLDLTKIEADRFDVVFEDVPLAGILAEVAEAGEMLAKARHNLFRVQDRSGATLLRTDRRAVGQILLNLVSNACKFTERGTVTLLAASDAEGHTVSVSVTDTGIGIPADALSRVFDEFYQVDGTTTRKVGGTGLGLAIARRMAGVIGGTLTVESVVGRGSTFTLTLPMKTASIPDTSLAVAS